MSDIGSFGSQWANTGASQQARANVRPETPPPLTIQSAVAQTLNTPQTAVMQSPTAGNADWRRETNPDGQGQGAHSPPEDAPTREQLDAFLERLNQQMRRHNTHLQFEVVDGSTDRRIRIIDQDTRNLVRWISLEETRAFARSLEELEIQSAPGSSGMGSGLLRVTA